MDKKDTRPEDVLRFWFGPLDSSGLPGQEATVRWFTGGPDFDRRHQVVIDRFGRFPARNAALGRVSTSEEIEFLRRNKKGF